MQTSTKRRAHGPGSLTESERWALRESKEIG